MTLKITESSEIVQGWMYSKAPTSIHEALNIHRQLSKIVLSFKFSKFPCRSERKIFIEISARQRYWQRRLLPLLIARCTMMRLCFPIEHLLLKPEVHPEDQPANLPTCQPANQFRLDLLPCLSKQLSENGPCPLGAASARPALLTYPEGSNSRAPKRSSNQSPAWHDSLLVRTGRQS